MERLWESSGPSGFHVQVHGCPLKPAEQVEMSQRSLPGGEAGRQSCAWAEQRGRATWVQAGDRGGARVTAVVARAAKRLYGLCVLVGL